MWVFAFKLTYVFELVRAKILLLLCVVWHVRGGLVINQMKWMELFICMD
jgi:hypothetical protein